MSQGQYIGPAASVTESAGQIWAELAGRYGLSLVLLEHHPAPEAGEGAETLDLLTELPDVFAVQAGCPSRRPIAAMSTMPESPGRFGLTVSLIGTESGHTGRDGSPSVSSLPIFDVSLSRP
jgi:hypothetical protein